MKVLILEDEPIIAIDLEDIVLCSLDAECFLATTVAEGLRMIESGIDFAMLDISLGRDTTSFPVAAILSDRHIPFCFVSSGSRQTPRAYGNVPFVSKPFRPFEIERVLPKAA